MTAERRRSEELQLDLERYELRQGEDVLRLERIPMELLILLTKKKDQLVDRQEIIEKLWGKDVFLDTEQGINTAIRKIRIALHDDPEQPRFVQTVVGKGYRFVGPITLIGNGEMQPIQTSVEVTSKTVDSIAHRLNTRTVAIVFVGFLICGGAVLALNSPTFRYRFFSRAQKPQIHTLAVLPLANLTGSPEQEYFADGMTDALITELGKLNSPRVISRQSVMQYKGSKKSLREIAQELNVDAILEGAVGRSGDRVQITVRLAQASPERQLWAQEYDRSIRDVFSVQDDIARTVIVEMRSKVTPDERTRLSSGPPVNPEAHDYYLRGRYLLGLAVTHHSRLDERQYTEPDIQAAIGHFKHAIENDTAYALAYAGLADAYILLGNPVWGGHSPKETLSDAKVAAKKALELDPSLAEAHFSLAQTLEYDWNWSEAEKEYQLALKLNPNYADAHLEYGRFVQALRRNDEAMTQMNYAMELDPFGIKTRVVVAYVTYASHQYDLAVEQFERLGDDWGMIWAYREKRMYPEAIAAWERWKASHPLQYRDPHPLATMAGIYGLEGRKREAEELIDELKEAARHRYVSGFFFAEAYVGIGQKDQAVAWLERAFEDHDQWMVFVNSYPGLDRLRSEPRFDALLRRMNFPQ